jgi:hypothetical protein
MYAIRKPKGERTDVFVMFPGPILTEWINGKRLVSPMKEWLIEHAVENGYRDGRVVGVYLSDVDAVAFKLKFGL